jgi:acetyl-CoA acyltransferase
MQTRDVVIVSAVRTAVGRIALDPAAVDDVLWGCAKPESSQGSNVGRLSLLRAGFPTSVSGATVNRFCSSGLQTIAMAAQAIMTGMNDVVIAGGVEMMSQIPMPGFNPRRHPELTEAYIGMGLTAENIATRWGISREAQDRFALASQQKAAAAWASGAFAEEIVPVPLRRMLGGGTGTASGEPFARDELMRPNTTLEGLTKLKPAFLDTGSVTAGNSSPLSDGAAALVLTSAERAKELGLKPLARFITFGVAGVDPDIMGIGPVKAVPKALAQAGLKLGDIALIELNEAFAAQALAVMHDLDMDPTKVNVNGGAIALGHPLGATGAKLTAQLVHTLGRRGGGLGMVTMCVGGGMGAAGIFEVYPA